MFGECVGLSWSSQYHSQYEPISATHLLYASDLNFTESTKTRVVSLQTHHLNIHFQDYDYRGASHFIKVYAIVS